MSDATRAPIRCVCEGTFYRDYGAGRKIVSKFSGVEVFLLPDTMPEKALQIIQRDLIGPVLQAKADADEEKYIGFSSVRTCSISRIEGCVGELSYKLMNREALERLIRQDELPVEPDLYPNTTTLREAVGRARALRIQYRDYEPEVKARIFSDFMEAEAAKMTKVRDTDALLKLNSVDSDSIAAEARRKEKERAVDGVTGKAEESAKEASAAKESKDKEISASEVDELLGTKKKTAASKPATGK